MGLVVEIQSEVMKQSRTMLLSAVNLSFELLKKREGVKNCYAAAFEKALIAFRCGYVGGFPYYTAYK